MTPQHGKRPAPRSGARPGYPEGSRKGMEPGFQGGFTLIEILVVIVILSILGGLAAQTLLSRPDAARVQAAQTDLRTLFARTKKLESRGLFEEAAGRSLGFALFVRKH